MALLLQTLSRAMCRHAVPIVALVVALLEGASSARAQSADDTNRQYSLGYEYRRMIKERVRGFGDLVYREVYDPDFLFGSQNALSTTGGVSYDLGKHSRIEGGLGLYYIHRTELIDTFELRLWQAATVDWPDASAGGRRWVLQHRFRLEQRFRSTEDWSVGLRFRYRLGFTIPLNRHSVEPGSWFIPLKTEFFVPLGDDLEELFADRVRFTAGLGYVFDKSWTLVVRYAQARRRDTIDADLEATDHFIELRVKSSFRIIDLIKGR